MLKIFEVKIEKLEARLFDFEKENDALKSELKKHKREIERVEDEAKQSVVDLEQTILLQGERINDLDQYSRRNNVVITGIKEDKNTTETAEKTAEIVVNTLKDKMNDLQLNVNDIDISHRMGRKQVDYKRPIIVRFLQRTKRDTLMRRRKDLKETGVFINEDLSRMNKMVLNSAKRQLSENESVWAFNGNLYHRSSDHAVNRIDFASYKD